MSRDWTPVELDAAHKQFPEMRKSLEKGNMTIAYNGETYEMYSDEDRENFKIFPHLALCGLDFLMTCQHKGIMSNKKGIKLIADVEKVINGEDIDNKEFADKIKLWYQGQLEPGYYMQNNNAALVEEIENLLRKCD